MIFSPLAIVLAIVAVVLAIGYALLVEMQAQTLSTIDIPPHHEARLIQLDRIAIEQAYAAQVTFLFQQWMKDQTGQPIRALRGARQARSAYSDAMKGIEQRERDTAK